MYREKGRASNVRGPMCEETIGYCHLFLFEFSIFVSKHFRFLLNERNTIVPNGEV